MANIHANQHQQKRAGQRMAQTNMIIPTNFLGNNDHTSQKNLRDNPRHEQPGGPKINVTRNSSHFSTFLSLVYRLATGGIKPNCCKMLIWSINVQSSTMRPLSMRAKI